MIRKALVLVWFAAALLAIWGFVAQGVRPADTGNASGTQAVGQGVTPADTGSASSAQGAGPQVVDMAQAERQVSGKAVAYFFTAPGCTSCVPDVETLQRAAQGRPSVQLVGVDVVSQDAPADFASWLQAQGLTSDRFIWTIDSGNKLVTRFRITGLGMTVLVDSTGKVRFVNQYTTDGQLLAGQLDQLS